MQRQMQTEGVSWRRNPHCIAPYFYYTRTLFQNSHEKSLRGKFLATKEIIRALPIQFGKLYLPSKGAKNPEMGAMGISITTVFTAIQYFHSIPSNEVLFRFETPSKHSALQAWSIAVSRLLQNQLFRKALCAVDNFYYIHPARQNIHLHR
jgi:hypothetical protein